MLKVSQNYIFLHTFKRCWPEGLADKQIKSRCRDPPLRDSDRQVLARPQLLEAVKTNRLLEKHEGLRDAGAGVRPGRPPREATPPAPGGTAASSTVWKRHGERGVCSKEKNRAETSEKTLTNGTHVIFSNKNDVHLEITRRKWKNSPICYD